MEMAALKITGDSISKDFGIIRKRTDYLAAYIEGLYKKGILSRKEKITESEFGSEYKSHDDGGSAIFVSSTVPYNDEVKNVICITYNLDSIFRDIIDSLGSLVKQVRYSERHSFMRFYPYADVQAQLSSDMDARSYPFYLDADDQHNKERKNVVVSDPFIDPTGKGRIISSVTPVYYNYIFQGVAELDVTVDAINEKYLRNNQSDIMIVDSCGICIAIDEMHAGIFNMPVKKAVKYAPIANDENYSSDDINLLKSKDKKIRAAFELLIRKGLKTCELDLETDNYRLFSYRIPELNWYIVKFEKI